MADLPAPSSLPARLVDRDQWVCWRTQECDGTPTKAPTIPQSGAFALTIEPDTRRSFAVARKYAAEGAADGIGFVFTAADPVVGMCSTNITMASTDDIESGEMPDGSNLTEQGNSSNVRIQKI